MHVFPTGWSKAHLIAWFDDARAMARIADRDDLPLVRQLGPDYAPSPRDLVNHAHMIVRHLGMPFDTTSPWGPQDQSGCNERLEVVRKVVLLKRQRPQRNESQQIIPSKPPSSLMTCNELADMYENPIALESFLRRIRKKHVDCCSEIEGTRKNEPRFLYREADLRPELQKRAQKRSQKTTIGSTSETTSDLK